jgi:hypothetical protein
MTEDSAGTDQRGVRRPYVKPFIRNLDAADTEGGKFTLAVEFTSPVHETEHMGPLEIIQRAWVKRTAP